MNITVQEETKSQLGIFEASIYIIFNILQNYKHKMHKIDNKGKKKEI